MNLQDKLTELKQQKKGILATNFYNFETLTGILSAVAVQKTPVILQLSKSSIDYMGLKTATNMARAAIAEYEVEAWLHLDHGDSVELVKSCLDAGFDSVMIDASEKAISENIKITNQVMKLASPYNANVESELGFIAKLGQEQNKAAFTQVEDAVNFIENTDVNALAIAIGSSHGFYKQAPKLEIELLSRISESIPTPLVLHGSSGIPDKMLQDAIQNGICKVNLATEIKNAFMLALQRILKDNKEIDLRIVFPEATKEVTSLVINKLQIVQDA